MVDRDTLYPQIVRASVGLDLSEAQHTTDVIYPLLGNKCHAYKMVESNVSFKNLAPLTRSSSLPALKPDYYNGGLLELVDEYVRKHGNRYIVPLASSDGLILPNFAFENKGCDGAPRVLNR